MKRNGSALLIVLCVIMVGLVIFLIWYVQARKTTSDAQPSISVASSTSSTNQQSRYEIISSSTLSFSPEEGVLADVTQIKRYFPDANGNWQVNLDDGTAYTSSAGTGLTNGQSLLVMDVAFTNQTQNQTFTIAYPEMFKIEPEGTSNYQAIYDDNITSAENGEPYYQLQLLPLQQSGSRTLIFELASSSSIVDFWYGGGIGNYVDGYVIDLNKDTVVPFKG